MSLVEATAKGQTIKIKITGLLVENMAYICMVCPDWTSGGHSMHKKLYLQQMNS